jgi:hypothetical protein
MLQAQEEQPLYYAQFNASFQLAVPIESFRSELEEVGPGISGSMLFQLGRGRPLFAGIDFAWSNFDSESVEYSTNQNGFDEDFRLRTRTNYLHGHAMVRFKPFTGFFIQPYADGLLGFKRLYARTTLMQLFNDDDEELVEASIDQSDSALSLGVGGGFQIRLSHHPDIMLDLRCLYLMGGSATFLVKREDITGNLNDPIDAFEERRSTTGVLLPQIGVTIQISDGYLDDAEQREF